MAKLIGTSHRPYWLRESLKQQGCMLEQQAQQLSMTVCLAGQSMAQAEWLVAELNCHLTSLLSSALQHTRCTGTGQMARGQANWPPNLISWGCFICNMGFCVPNSGNKFPTCREIVHPCEPLILGPLDISDCLYSLRLPLYKGRLGSPYFVRFLALLWSAG